VIDAAGGGEKDFADSVEDELRTTIFGDAAAEIAPPALASG